MAAWLPLLALSVLLQVWLLQLGWSLSPQWLGHLCLGMMGLGF